jgi:hypothetical protein
MRMPNNDELLALREEFPQGTRVELISMEDSFTELKAGDRATVVGVDGYGDILCNWDKGSSLKLIPSADRFRKLTKVEIITESVRAVGQTGRVNMFSAREVFDIAMEMGFITLCDFMFMNTPAYSNLILTGELSEEDIIEF